MQPIRGAVSALVLARHKFRAKVRNFREASGTVAGDLAIIERLLLFSLSISDKIAELKQQGFNKRRLIGNCLFTCFVIVNTTRHGIIMVAGARLQELLGSEFITYGNAGTDENP